MTTRNPYPCPPTAAVTDLRINQARLEERVDAVEGEVADVRNVGLRLEGKLDRLILAVVVAALSFAGGSAAVAVAVMGHFNG